METKFIEIRDRATFIPALAISVSAMDGYLAGRAGFGPSPSVILIHLQTMKSACDSYDWGDARTMPQAHEYIQTHWKGISNGDVVDVEYILGESAGPKTSEQFYNPPFRRDYKGEFLEDEPTT